LANYSLNRGNTWGITITVTQGGSAIDITHYHIMCTVKQSLTNTDAQAVWQGDNSTLGGVTNLTQSGSTLGQAIIVMPASATEALTNPSGPPFPVLNYDVVCNDGSGNIETTETGQITLYPRVTLTQP
jgi:archaellin